MKKLSLACLFLQLGLFALQRHLSIKKNKTTAELWRVGFRLRKGLFEHYMPLGFLSMGNANQGDQI